MNYKKAILPGYLLLFVFCLIACFNPALVHSSISIGALWDLSGPGAEQGKAALQAAREVINSINARTGPQGPRLEIIVADTQGKKDQVLIQASKLIKQQDVIALIGTTSPALSVTLRTMAESYEVPLVLTCGQSPLLPARGRLPMLWTFSSNPRMDVWIRAMLEGLSRTGLKVIGPLVQDSKLGQEIALWLRAYAPEMKVKTLPTQSFNAEDADVIAQLNWFKEQGAQVAVVWGPVDWSHTLLASTLATGFPVAVPPPMLSPLTTGILGAKAGLISITPPVVLGEKLPSSHPCSLPVLRFLNAMGDKLSANNALAIMSAGAAWDAIHLIARALNAAEDSTRAALRDAMENAEEPYYGVMGVFRWDKRDHCGISPDSQLLIKRGKNGWALLVRHGR